MPSKNNLKIIICLLLPVLMASCNQEESLSIYSTDIKVMGRDTILELNMGDEEYKRIGTKFICPETLDIAEYHVLQKAEKIKTVYESKGLFYNLSIDTLYNAEASFRSKEAVQNYKDKLMINCKVNYISNTLGNTTPPKEMLDYRILKDLKTGNVEKIVVYIDSIEYLLDVSKSKNKSFKKYPYY